MYPLPPFNNRPAYSLPIHKVPANYNLDKATSLFARVATGYRAPSIQGRILFFDASAVPAGTSPISIANAEKVLSAEVGFKADLRDYGVGAQILANLGLHQIKLITNNPRKIVGIEGYGLNVVERVPIEIAPRAANVKYLRTKKKKLGHILKKV